MDAEQVKRLVRQVAKSGWLRTTDHCRRRMAERNVTMEDMLQVLLWGEVHELKASQDRQNWECLVRGFDLEKEPLAVKVAVLENDFALLCITVHG
jgi:hypothetical protein